MADIRCQMCGKTNPDHLEECQHCGARLKPLISSHGLTEEDSGSNWTDASQEGTLSWLRSIGQDEDGGEGSPAEGDDLPDWLRDSSEMADDNASADWMDEGGQGDAIAASDFNEQTSSWDSPDAEAGFDDWLPVGEESSGLQDDGLEDFFSQTERSEEDTGTFSEEPSWLSENKGEEKTIPAPDFPGGLSSDDDWLNSIGNEESLTETMVDWKQTTEGSPEDASDLPSWLTSSPNEVAQPDSGDFDDDLPSWLSGGESDYPVSAEPAQEGSPSSELDGEFPDWLDSMESKTGMTGKLGDMPQWIDENEETESPSDPSFDWLATLGDTPEETSMEDERPSESGVKSALDKEAIGGLAFGPEDSFIADIGDSETPDWLQGLQNSDSEHGEPSDNFSSGFQSSWGFDSPPQANTWQESETDEEEEASSALEDSSLPGGLPSWVQAFRPMEGADVATEHVEGEIERVGPLAGLRDLLTPEADVSKTTKPPSYSVDLQVSAVQQTNAQLLQALVESENIPQPLLDASPLTSQRILRIVFGAILILIMLFPLISGTQNIPLPSPLPQEIRNIVTLSNGVPLDRPMLVAFDYEPGTSGELEAATKVLFDRLMDRNIPLALVSTSPLGTSLGERQVAYLQRQFLYNHEYIYGENYVNLGYIPGGPAGLANFALSPERFLQVGFDSAPVWEMFNFDETNPWNTSIMQPINGLGDFSMTVLLTDNPDTARNWLEQVEPVLRRNSLVIVASAQAEPFIRPYYQNPDPAQRQVEGLLVGLRGGAALEQDQGQSGPARLYWDTFGIGLLVAVALILMGGGYNYLDEMRKSQRQARKSKGKS